MNDQEALQQIRRDLDGALADLRAMRTEVGAAVKPVAKTVHKARHAADTAQEWLTFAGVMSIYIVVLLLADLL